ncbi:hypothetical protein OSJ57_07950 [Sphingomonas sp. HH69]
MPEKKPARLFVAMLVAGTSGAHVAAQTPGMALPKEPAGANAAIRTVEVDPSVSVDGVTDEEEIERRQVRSLDRQGSAMLAAAKQRADAIQRNYEEAMARSRIEEKLYRDALARHSAEMEAWQRARDQHVPR